MGSSLQDKSTSSSSWSCQGEDRCAAVSLPVLLLTLSQEPFSRVGFPALPPLDYTRWAHSSLLRAWVSISNVFSIGEKIFRHFGCSVTQLHSSYCYRLGVGGRQLTGKIWPMAPFGTAHKLRLGFTFLKGSHKNNKEYVTEPLCGLQSLKILLPQHLQRKFASSC